MERAVRENNEVPSSLPCSPLMVVGQSDPPLFTHLSIIFLHHYTHHFKHTKWAFLHFFLTQTILVFKRGYFCPLCSFLSLITSILLESQLAAANHGLDPADTGESASFSTDIQQCLHNPDENVLFPSQRKLLRLHLLRKTAHCWLHGFQKQL